MLIFLHLAWRIIFYILRKITFVFVKCFFGYSLFELRKANKYGLINFIVFVILILNKIGFLWSLYTHNTEEVIKFLIVFRKILIIAYIGVFINNILL
jgi:hypothetical protein